MEEMEVYTMEQWAKDRMFNAKPGQFVEESIYWQMLNCVPPRSCSRDYMQVGEADGTCPKTGRDTYATFARENGMWKFVGYLPFGEGRPRLKDFSDLVFEPHYIGLKDHTQAKMKFDNGYGVSVICGTLFYSNGVDTYEVATLKKDLIDFNHQVTGDVFGYRTKQEVSDIMARIQRM